MIPENLLDELDHATPEAREAAYMGLPASLRAEDVAPLLRTGRAGAEWLLLRSLAGPPGCALPDRAAALDRVMAGEGDVLDAWSVLMQHPELPGDAPLTPILVNCAVSAWKPHGSVLALWLSLRAALAALARGESERCWAWFDVDRPERPAPGWDVLRTLGALRASPELASSYWTRRAAWGLYARRALPAIPQLERPDGAPERSRREYVEAIEATGAGGLRDIILDGMSAWDHAVIAALGAHPAVRALEEAVLRGEHEPPDLPAPEGLDLWMWAAHLDGRHAAARLAALALLRAGFEPAGGPVLMVMGDARPADARLLAERAPEELRPLWRELADIVRALPEGLWRDLSLASAPLRADFVEASARVFAAREQVRAVVEDAHPQILARLEAIEQAEAAIARSAALVPPVLAAVADIRRRLPPIDRLAPGALIAAVEAARPVEEPTLVGMHLDIADPMDRLLAGLLLRRSIRAMDPPLPDAAGHLGEYAWYCARALWDVRSYRLFPLREELLVEASRAAPSPQARVRARLALANTRNALSSGDDARIAETERLLAGAVEESWSLGDAELVVDAVFLWTRTLTLGPLSDPERGAVLLQVARDTVARVAALVGTGDLRGRVAWAEATLLRHGGPDKSGIDHAAALVLLEEAAGRLGERDPGWIDVQRERAHSLVVVGRVDDGIRVLRDLVERRAGDLDNLERGYLLGALGDALVAAELVGEARLVLRDAVRLVGDDGPGAHICLQYVRLLVDAGEREGARDLLARVHARAERLSAADRLDLHLLRMAVASASGERAALDDATRAATVIAVGTHHEPLLLLRRAMLDGDGDASLAITRRYVGGEWARSSAVDHLVSRVVLADPEGLPPELRERAIAWAREAGETWTAARLLDAGGRTPEARALLERFVADCPDRRARVRARVLLLAMMPREETGALRAAIEATERDAEDLSTLGGPGLCDLGAACSIAAAGDPAWTHRGRAHVELALKDSAGASWAAHAAHTYARLTREIVAAAVPRSTAEVAEVARAALAHVRHIEPDRMRVVYELAGLLLLGGPLAHADGVDVAEALVIAAGGHDSLAKGLLARANSIREVRAGRRQRVLAMPAELNATVPLDDGPGWLVRVVTAEEDAGELDAGEAVRDLRDLQLACAVRPDRADVLLARILGLGPKLKPKALRKVLGTVHAVAATGRQGSAGWDRTRGALEALRALDDSDVLRILEAMDGSSAPKPPPRPAPKDAPASASRVSAEQEFDLGLRAMTSARAARDKNDARAWRARAVSHLQAALARATGKLKREAHISLGNALRLEPDRDCDAAIEHYERAAAIRSADSDSDSRLHKVWADALAQRGSDEDVRAAWTHIQESLRLRRDGGFRTASLVSASNIAFLHPDWSETERARGVARALGEAALINAREIEVGLPRLLVALAKWAHSGSDPAERSALVKQLLRLFPASRAEIARAAEGHTAFALVLNDRQDPTALIGVLLGDANFRVVVETLALLQSPAERASHAADFRPGAMVPPHLRAEFERAERERPSLHGDLKGIRRRLADLADGSADTRAGRAVATTILLAELCRARETPAGKVRQATATARDAIGGLPGAELRSALLDCLATVWSPRDVHGDPVSDFPLTVALAREAMDAVGGEEHAHRDVLGRLGRALRYSPEGDHQQNLRDALRLYRRVLELDRKAGWAPGIANDLDLIADLESHAGEGDETARLLRSVEASREAIRLAVDPHSKALYSGNLAWALTKLGDRLEPAAAVASLSEAEALYQHALSGPLSESERSNIQRNRTVCRELLAGHHGDTDEGVRLWRAELDRLARERVPIAVATGEHNLAEALVRRGGEEDLREAVGLYRRALRHRTLEANPRFHWESNLALGRTLLHLVEAVEDEPEDAWFEEAERCFVRAIETARLLGSGQELHWAGKDLLVLAGYLNDPGELSRLGELGWAAITAARGALILHREYAVEGALLAQNIAFAMANMLRDEGVLAPMQGGFLLRRKRAERVERWLLRSDRAFTDLVDARLRMPSGASAAAWAEWQRAVAAQDDGAVVRQVEAFQRADPAWLGDGAGLEHTLAWLRRVRGSVAIGVWPGQTGALCLLIDGDSGDRVVLGLSGPPIPDEPSLARALRGEGRGDLLERLVAHSRVAITDRVVSWIGRTPGRVLWCPHGALRLAPPGALFPGAEVAVTSSLALREPRPVRSRGEGVSIVLADPGAGMRGLGSAALDAVERLARAVGSSARIVASVGGRSGPSVLGSAADAPASAEQVLREIDHAGTLVLLAHGTAEGPDAAWIECVGADGTPQRLDATMLQRDPLAVAGLSAVLLSCESGRAGDIPGHVGGVAGALLAAGAREVVAPLWPVGLAGAVRVAEAALAGRTRGQDLSAALAKVSQEGDAAGPELGRRAPDPAAQRASARWDVLGFVTWVG